MPVCAELLDAAAAAGEIRADVDAFELMRGVGNLCVGAESDPRYDARRMVGLLIAGLRLRKGNRRASRRRSAVGRGRPEPLE